MAKVPSTLKDPHVLTVEESQTTHHQTVHQDEMHTGLVRLKVSALTPSVLIFYDMLEVSTYITTVLQQFRQQDSYGLFGGVSKEDTEETDPTLIFGLPGVNVSQVDLPPTPFGIPTLVKQDHIIWIPEIKFQANMRWAIDPVVNIDNIQLQNISIGIEGKLSEARSFGGFLKHDSFPGEIYGITAAHCVPNAPIGSSVCSPSTLEITSRFKYLLSYTSLARPRDHRHLILSKDIEAKSLLHDFKFQETADGVYFIDPIYPTECKQVVLNGTYLGEVIVSDFDNKPELLYSYDQKLQSLNLLHFSTSTSWKTRMDWSILLCDIDRYGGNIYGGHSITNIADLYPGAEVEKIGLTTGLRLGRVHGITIQHWNVDKVTHEIAIIGKGKTFADFGDSGSCVLVNDNGTYKAAGILIGKNQQNDFSIATPLRIILDASGYKWA